MNTRVSLYKNISLVVLCLMAVNNYAANENNKSGWLGYIGENMGPTVKDVGKGVAIAYLVWFFTARNQQVTPEMMRASENLLRVAEANNKTAQLNNTVAQYNLNAIKNYKEGVEILAPLLAEQNKLKVQQFEIAPNFPADDIAFRNKELNEKRYLHRLNQARMFKRDYENCVEQNRNNAENSEDCSIYKNLEKASLQQVLHIEQQELNNNSHVRITDKTITVGSYQ